MQHYNYDFFSGIDYTIDVRKPVGQRVTSIVFEGHELGEDEPVTVCINSYRFCGTGGYDMLPRQKVAREVLTDVADAMIDYITTPNKDFQPMGANMGILPRTEEIDTIRDKRERYMALSDAAQAAMRAWAAEAEH